MNEFTGFEGQRVLVVDDHAISRDYASAALRQSGMSVKATCTVAAALEAIDFHPDVVVCDWRLPDGTGRGVYDAIRAAWSGRRTPPRFVLLCGNPEDIPLNWLKQAEIERVLRKPCSLQTLLEAMRPSSWQVSEMTSPTAGRTDKEITGMVRAEMRQRVPGLAAAIDEREFGEAASIAHQLTASAALCRARSLEASFRELGDVCANQPDPARTAASWCRLESALESFLDAERL